jgi:outer membrane protein assembly factor BamB
MRKSRLLRRWLIALGSTAAVAALVAAIAAPRPLKPLWSTLFLPGGISAAGGFTRLQAYGTDRLLGSGLLQAPVLYDYSGHALWTAGSQTMGASCICTALAADGSIYVGTNKNDVYAFDPQQRLRWVFPATGTKTWSCYPAAGADGKVYVTATDGVIYALDADGGQLWREEIDDLSGHRPPTVGPDGTIYAGTRNEELVAIAPDGQVKWRTGRRGIGLGPEMFSQNHIITVQGRDSIVFAYNGDGTIAWRYYTPGTCDESRCQVGADGTIYICSSKDSGARSTALSESELLVLDPIGRLKWSAPAGGTPFDSCCVLPDGRVCIVGSFGDSFKPGQAFDPFLNVYYLLSRHGLSKLRVLDANGNTVRSGWLPMFFTIVPPVVLPDGKILLLGDNGKLHCYQP